MNNENLTQVDEEMEQVAENTTEGVDALKEKMGLKNEPKAKSSIKDTIATMIFVFGFTFLLFEAIIYLFHPIIVIGNSMSPTLKNHSIHLSENVDKDTELKRGDVVSIKTTHRVLLKRIVGCPGDELVIKDGVLYVNGVADERYEYIEKAGVLSDPIILGDNEYFGIGDNVNNSVDCRDLGPATKGSIISKLKGEW